MIFIQPLTHTESILKRNSQEIQADRTKFLSSVQIMFRLDPIPSGCNISVIHQ